MRDRIGALQKMLPAGVDGVVIVSPQNRYYFTGMRSSAGTLLVTRDKSYFLIDFRYIELAKRTVKNAEVVLQDKPDVQLREIAARHNIKTLAVETSYMTVGERSRMSGWLPEVELLEAAEVNDAIMALRSQKDEEELAFVRAAQSITDDCYAHILSFICPGVTEREIAVELHHNMMKQGAGGLAFGIICVSGVNSSLPHGVPSDKAVEAGDFLTMDFGAMVEGYCSDMTRTVAIGHVTDEMAKVYETVLAAQLKAIDAIALGTECAKIDKVARDIIYSAGYEGCFGHNLGHSLGLDIHEEPRFSSACQEPCKPGMIITVEPGIYLEGKFGCRIEDMVFIGEDGVINLTGSPKELTIL